MGPILIIFEECINYSLALILANYMKKYVDAIN